MYSTRPYRTPPGGFGLPGRPPTDLIVVLAVVFVTFALQFFPGVGVLPALMRLTPAVWQAGFLWQLVTYPFAGFGAPSLWFLVELFVLYWFSSEVFTILGRRWYWRLHAWSLVGAGVAAVAGQLLASLVLGRSPSAFPFQLMQGQRILVVVAVAAFAVLRRDATVYLFFVLPVRAGWFLWIEVLIAFIAFLGTMDVAGFIGVCAATGITWGFLTRRGPRQLLKRARLSLDRALVEWRLRRLRRERPFRVVDDRDEGPTVH